MGDAGGTVAVLTGPIRTVATTGSTNADLIALAAEGAAEGLWLRAEVQTAGRGRQGRVWMSPPGNLYASTLVRLRPGDPPAATLALLAGVALWEAVAAYLVPHHVELSISRHSGLEPGSRFSPGGGSRTRAQGRRDDATGLILKWPNDLLLGSAKLAGILLERADNAVIAGFGVNLAHHPDSLDRPVTSLAAYGHVVDPAQLVETLAERFAHWLARWRGEGLAPVRDRWLPHAHPAGTALTARLADGAAIDGLFAGLDADGALILRLADGTRRAIHAGDVFLL